MAEFAAPNCTGMKRTASAERNSDESAMLTRKIKPRKYAGTRFAVCMNNKDYPVALERHKVYRVLPDADAAQDGDLRIVDESGEDYLYPAENFLVIELPLRTERVLQRSFARAVA
jgi:hypothetical protein